MAGFLMENTEKMASELIFVIFLGITNLFDKFKPYYDVPDYQTLLSTSIMSYFYLNIE